MIDKTKLRQAVADVLERNSQHEFKYIDKEILNSKEFMQKIYRKNFRLFNWLPLYVEERDIWNEVYLEQEKIKLGNAFNQFCRDAKLIKPNHNINIDDMSTKETNYFKAFNQMYEMNKEMKNALLVVSDYATYGIACGMDNTQDFNYHHYSSMRNSLSFAEMVEQNAKKTIEFVEDKGYV